jgi:hypothetical protein
MEFHHDDLPRSPAQWEKAQRNLEAQTIPALGKLDSASEKKRPQFLLLRALWDVRMQHEFKEKGLARREMYSRSYLIPS